MNIARTNDKNKVLKPTISIKSASSYSKQRKLSELGAIIKGTSYPSLEPLPMFQTKGASSQLERQAKLRELARLVRA